MERHQRCALVNLIAGTLLVAGCADRDARPTPVDPTAIPGGTPQREFGLSGVVSDSADRPLEGSSVVVVGGPRSGTTAISDEQGRISFPGTFTNSVTLTASKDGYNSETKSIPPQNIPADRLPPPAAGERWETVFRLEPAGPAVNIAGNYTVTLSASSACTNVPAQARRRTYTATIVGTSRSTAFLLRLDSGRFFSMMPCPSANPESCIYNRLSIGTAGDFANIGGYIIEQLDDSGYLVVSAGSTGTFNPSGAALPLEGSWQYCPRQPTWTSGEYWDCEGSIQCDSANHQLTLVRR